MNKMFSLIKDHRRRLAYLRLAVHLILQGRQGDFCCLFGTVCSSWVAINAGTSRRSLLLPEGAEHLEYIRLANSMVSRSDG